jgi:hypothetical protein
MVATAPTSIMPEVVAATSKNYDAQEHSHFGFLSGGSPENLGQAVKQINHAMFFHEGDLKGHLVPRVPAAAG